MRGAILPLPQYAFMAWCLVKHREKFTFYRSPIVFIIVKFMEFPWGGHVSRMEQARNLYAIWKANFLERR
jgi:hypothetical protein